MRKIYVKPTLISEEFIPQVYCGACKNAEGVTTYSASCDTSGYVFWDTNKNGVFDNGTDQYASKNIAGTSCSFTINYHPGDKNAFIFTDSSDLDIEYGMWGAIKSVKVKTGHESKAIFGYRIEEYDRWGNLDDSHFIANLNSDTFRPNMS